MFSFSSLLYFFFIRFFLVGRTSISMCLSGFFAVFFQHLSKKWGVEKWKSWKNSWTAQRWFYQLYNKRNCVRSIDYKFLYSFRLKSYKYIRLVILHRYSWFMVMCRSVKRRIWIMKTNFTISDIEVQILVVLTRLYIAGLDCYLNNWRILNVLLGYTAKVFPG